MSFWFKIRFLFSSFGPLYLIFAVKLFLNVGVPKQAGYVAAAATMMSALAFISIARQLRSTNPTMFDLTDSKAKDGEVFSYITTYIPPLIARDMSDPAVYLPLSILYLIIIAAYLRLDAPYINPYFIVFGYRIYEARMKQTRSLVTVILKGRRLAGSETVSLHEVGNGDLYYCDPSSPLGNRGQHEEEGPEEP